MASLLFVSACFFIVLSGSSVRALTCPQAVATLSPCLAFLQGKGSNPSAPCCLGARNLNNMASTTEIRRQVCGCLKEAVISFGIDISRAKAIPEVCKIPVPVPIDPSVDCNTYVVSFSTCLLCVLY